MDQAAATIERDIRKPMAREIDRRRAFEALTQARLDRAYRLAGIILRDRSEAEDAVHDAAVQAWLHIAELREPNRMDAWFDRILVNACRSRLRQRKVAPLGARSPVDAALADPFLGVNHRDVLQRALDVLDADHRIAVVLRYVVDLSTAEIATRTGVPEGTVKSRLHYALRELRATLEAVDRTGGESHER